MMRSNTLSSLLHKSSPSPIKHLKQQHHHHHPCTTTLFFTTTQSQPHSIYNNNNNNNSNTNNNNNKHSNNTLNTINNNHHGRNKNHTNQQQQQRLQDHRRRYQQLSTASKLSSSSSSPPSSLPLPTVEILKKFDVILDNMHAGISRLNFDQYSELIDSVLMPSYKRLHMELMGEGTVVTPMNDEQLEEDKQQQQQLHDSIIKKHACFQRLMKLIGQITLFMTLQSQRQMWSVNQLFDIQMKLMSFCSFISPELLLWNDNFGEKSANGSGGENTVQRMLLPPPNTSDLKVFKAIAIRTKLCLHLLLSNDDVRAVQVYDAYREIMIERLKPHYSGIMVPYVEFIIVNTELSAASSSASLSRARDLYMNEMRPHMNSILGRHPPHDSSTCAQCQFMEQFYDFNNREFKTYKSLVTAFAGRDESVVDALFDDIMNLKRRNHAQIFSYVIPMYLHCVATRAKDRYYVDACVEKARNCIPFTRMSYNNVLLAYARVNEPLQVKRVVEQICNDPKAIELIGPDTINIALASCKIKSKKQNTYDRELVRYFLSVLSKFPIKPHKQLYTTLLSILSALGDLNETKTLLGIIESQKVETDEKMLAAIVRTFLLLQYHDRDQRMQYLQFLRSEGQASVDLYNVFIRSILNEDTIEHDAYDTLLDMMIEDNIQPDDYTINSIVQLLKRTTKEHTVPPAITNVVMNLIKQSLLSPNPPSLDTLTSIVGFLYSSNQGQKALEVSQTMRKKYTLDKIAYTTIIPLYKLNRDIVGLIELGTEVLSGENLVDRILFEVLAKTIVELVQEADHGSSMSKLIAFAETLFVRASHFIYPDMQAYRLRDIVATIQQDKTVNFAVDRQLIDLLLKNNKLVRL